MRWFCMAHNCAISLFIFSLSRKKERKQNQKRDKRLLAVTVRLDAPICAVFFV